MKQLTFVSYLLLISILTYCDIQAQPPSDEVFTSLENMPTFIGCEKAGELRSERKDCTEKMLMEYMGKTLTPSVVVAASGSTEAHFVIEKDGTVKEVNLIRSLSRELDSEIKMALLKLQWNPGLRNGQPVRYMFKVPLSFQAKNLQDDIVIKTFRDVVCKGFEKITILPEQLVSMANYREIDDLCDPNRTLVKIVLKIERPGKKAKTLKSDKKNVMTDAIRDAMRNASVGQNLVFFFTFASGNQEVVVEHTLQVN